MNTIHKLRDALLKKVKAKMTHETRVELCKAFIYGLSELIPLSLITTAAIKLIHALHDKAICKAVSFEKSYQPAKPRKQSTRF